MGTRQYSAGGSSTSNADMKWRNVLKEGRQEVLIIAETNKRAVSLWSRLITKQAIG